MLAEAVHRLTHSTDLVFLIIIAFTLTLIAGWDLVQHNLWIYLFFLATFFGWGIAYTVYGLRNDQKKDSWNWSCLPDYRYSSCHCHNDCHYVSWLNAQLLKKYFLLGNRCFLSTL